MKRSKRKHNHSFALTPLLIILIVMVSFHLRGYLAATIQPGVNVQVSKFQIWVEDKEVLNTRTAKAGEIFAEDGKRINALFNELVKIREKIQRTEKLSPKAKPFSGVANLTVDKTLKYTYLKRILYTCAAAGFGKVNFISSVESR